jgi:hypothetical protein
MQLLYIHDVEAVTNEVPACMPVAAAEPGNAPEVARRAMVFAYYW